jgi:hypothetical protein
VQQGDDKLLGFVHLMPKPVSHKSLSILGCGDSITDKIVAAFAKVCPSSYIRLHVALQLTLVLLAQSCPGLEDVTLSRCGLRGSTAFKALCHFCRGLERLDVSGCHNIQASMHLFG